MKKHKSEPELMKTKLAPQENREIKASLNVAVIGSGPAGLMVAEQLAQAGCHVSVFEKRSGLGRKILIAGSSGLNISFDAPLSEFIKQYRGFSEPWTQILSQYPPMRWIQFVESLGLETFCGTSKRYFVQGMKGSSLLKAWVDSLKHRGVQFHLNHEVTGFETEATEEPKSDQVTIHFGKSGESRLGDADGLSQTFDAVCFCLGGGSWEPNEKPLRWPEVFRSKGIEFSEFHSSNSGFQVDWPPAFLKEAEGKPLKGIVFYSQKGSRAGELVITNYGLEGTPVYALGESGEVYLDLKPDLTEKEILKRLSVGKENLSPMRRIQKNLKLSPAALALLFHLTPSEIKNDLQKMVKRLKRFPITLKGRQPLEEAISSAGGVSWNELDSNLMLKKFPRVFLAGEMIDWDAPTGGFLIQGSVSLGYAAARGILKRLREG